MSYFLHLPRLTALTLLLLPLTASRAAELPAYRDPQRPIEARLDDLLARMSLEDKIGQMCQYVGIEHARQAAARKRGGPVGLDDTNGFYPGLSLADLERAVRAGRIGSFLHVVSAEEANHLQQLACESPLGIPLLIGIDAVHGNGLVRGSTIYPTPLSLAATFDLAAAAAVARQTAAEMRADGMNWTFAPNVDVARDPRWGRTGETFGEDPYLVGQLGAAMVHGFEGESLNGSSSVLSCIKHLIAGGEPVNGINGAPEEVSERTLRTVFLPPFLEALKLQPATAMTAHHDLNGVPCHANAWIIEDLLRKEGGFRGFVVSDWMDIERLATLHHVAVDQKDAVYQAVMAGIDMHMHGPDFAEPLAELVHEGRVPVSRIDEATRRILRTKFQLGLFEQTQVDPKHRADVVFCAEHTRLALETARRSIVLLKNEAVLPLDRNRFHRVLVTGPLADTHAMLGDWVLPQPEENVITPLEGLRQQAPTGMEIVTADCGKSVRTMRPDTIATVAAKAREADVAVVVVGDNSLRYDPDRTSGENTDRSEIELPGQQLELVQAIAATGKPVVVVLVGSRPNAIEWIADHVPAIVEAWEPGSLGGQALAEILFGTVNPSGRLPVTFPRGAGHLKTIYNYKPSYYSRTFAIGATGARYEFGHGLSYTTFAYTNLRLPRTIAPAQNIHVQVDVTNTGRIAGEDAVLLFSHDLVSSVTTPVRELQAFRRVALAPGETRTVELTIPYDHLALFDRSMHRVVEPGNFEISVGALKGRFTVQP